MIKKICLLILMMTGAIYGSVHDLKWQLWKSQYAKSYLNDTEELLRRQIWDSSLKKVMHHNKRADEGKESYWLEMNEFADMTIEEHVQDNSMTPWDVQDSSVRKYEEINEPIPEKFDWRDKHCVTRVKHQKKCRSCWAFSSVGAIESRYCVKTNQLHTFSEQQLVDCDTTNKGCNITSKDIAYKHNQTQVVVMRGNSMKYIAVVGKTKSSLCAKYGQLYSLSEQQMAECEKLNKDFHGNRFKALKYIQNVGGLMKETDYPYKAVDGVCHYDEKLAVKISISEIKKIDADKIAYDVYKYGPTTFSMRVIDDFHLYKKGIYSPTSDCSKSNGRHAMIIAGYDSVFWIVKNSWGSHWGEDGYVRIKRGVNVCSMENRVYSPYLQ